MDDACMSSEEELPPPTGRGPSRPCLVSPLNGSDPHALLYDLTHDNESPLHKRSAEDALSTGALATFSYCALGSVKGFDELYPKLLNLVEEKRKYEVVGVEGGKGTGIGKVKRILNSLHREIVLGGFEEGHVHQENDVSSADALPDSIGFLDVDFRFSILPFIAFSRVRRKGIYSWHTLHLRRGLKIVVSVSVLFYFSHKNQI
jgi:hypothetical protein